MINPNLDSFESYRPLMFSIAYRMLGSITEAEDMVQEAYLRYQRVPPEEIGSLKAFLSTVVTRLCLNHLELARNQRETYIGPWLPEPALTATDTRFIPASRAELQDSISMAFLVLLEQLSPLERAVFLLREVFDYDYAEIAAIMDKDEAACRQLFSRARKHIADHRPRFKPDPNQHRQLLQQFVQAVTTGDLDGVLQLLTDEATLTADSNGKIRGALNQPLRGREAVAKFLVASPRFVEVPLTPQFIEVNGEPSLLLCAPDGEVRVVMTMEESGGKVRDIRVVTNPDKLAAVNKVVGKR
jgi:RNA polymerase sigma-70 factor (ECF subfamily)